MAVKYRVISFVLAESARLKKGEIIIPQAPQSAPRYFAESVPRQAIVKKETRTMNETTVSVTLKAYQGMGVLLAEAEAEVADIFSDAAFEMREKLIDLCYEALKKGGSKTELAEEYSFAVVSNFSGDPEQFLKQRERIAGFLKSEKIILDEKELEYTLATQLKYRQNDLIILDWDGAFLFDPAGEEADIDPVVELIQLANLQLLRYRILDSDLDARLRRMAKLMQSYPAAKPFFWKNKELTNAFREVIAIRSKSLAEFDALDRDIKLIGEWYSARLYDLAMKKFKMDDWKRTVKDKLESLEDEYTIISQNFSVSRTQFLEVVQIILFFILQLGWFALIILEFGEFLK